MIDDKERQSIIREHGLILESYLEGIAAKDYIEKYDLLYFDELTETGLHTLLVKKYADPDERQNSAPDIATILMFLKNHPNFTCHGYIVTPGRCDCRVSVEGVRGENCSPEDIGDFASVFKRADEFTVNTDDDGINCYCWYD